jgi:HSP20 family molecular chaperone IbpA
MCNKAHQIKLLNMFYTQDFNRVINSMDAIFNSETTSEYNYKDGVFTMPLPGFSKKDLEIEMVGSTLTISAEVKEEDETFYKKSFKKTFKASNIDVESVTASMSNGILTIMLDKKVNPRKIKVA